MKKVLSSMGLAVLFTLFLWSIIYCMGLIATGRLRPWEWNDNGMLVFGMFISLIPAFGIAAVLVYSDSDR